MWSPTCSRPPARRWPYERRERAAVRVPRRSHPGRPGHRRAHRRARARRADRGGTGVPGRRGGHDRATGRGRAGRPRGGPRSRRGQPALGDGGAAAGPVGAGVVIRIAAVGDLYAGPDSVGTIRPRFEGVSDRADLLLLAGDLTRRGTAEEGRIVAEELAAGLEAALAGLRADIRIALTHYAPVDATLAGERLEIFPFLGSYLLAEAIDRAGADLAIHGHAHRGTEKGVTAGGVTVRNVAETVIGHAYKVYRVGDRSAGDVVSEATGRSSTSTTPSPPQFSPA